MQQPSPNSANTIANMPSVETIFWTPTAPAAIDHLDPGLVHLEASCRRSRDVLTDLAIVAGVHPQGEDEQPGCLAELGVELGLAAIHTTFGGHA